MSELREKRLAETKQVNQLRKTEKLSVEEACKKVGLTVPTYNYYQNVVLAKKKPVAAMAAAPKKKKQTKLTVTQLPVVAAKAPTSFLIFGAPSALAEFARAYE